MFTWVWEIYQRFKELFQFLVSPRSVDKDLARREFILNILLVGSIFLLIILTIHSGINQLKANQFEKTYYGGVPIGALIVILLLYLLGYYLSRLGRSRLIAYCLISIYFIGATYTAYQWGGSVPQVLLTYSLIIVMSGILIGSKFAFISTAIVTLVLLIIIDFQNKGLIHANFSWRSKLPTVRDALTYSTTLVVISLVSWLFNREIERALKRAQSSEKALRRQKDQLEIIVEKRTAQLRQAQMEKMTQLYRFAEFGRSASGLFHDLVNPLSVVSLNLKMLNTKSSSKSRQISEVKHLLERAITGTKRLESFIQGARKQVQNHQVIKRFFLAKEIRQALQLFQHRVNKSHINISFDFQKDIKLFGNPIKFNQLISNLVANAIDAYAKVRRKKKAINIRFQNIDDQVNLVIQDWGSGIAKKNLDKIFQPLFTTKGFNRGTGIGLSICKDIVEKDFGGTITVSSKQGIGTTFTIQFSLKRVRKLKI